MSAPNLIRVLSYCNRSLSLSRQLLVSQQCIKSHQFVGVSHRYKSNVKNKNLISMSFSANTSPDENQNASKKNVPNKRRRIISSSSSDGNDSPNTNIATEK